MTDTGPRILYDQPDTEYRAVDAVNYSSLKHVLDCPARYVWEKTHRVEKKVWDFGHAVHAIVLGAGEPLHRIDADTWRGNDAKAEADWARAQGAVPLLAKDYDRAHACAEAVKDHPLAGPILTRPGHSEASIYWTDDETGLDCKGRIDRVTITPDGTHWLIDLKTVGRTANPTRFARDTATFGYHIQAAYYLHGYAEATGTPYDQLRWLNIPVEVDQPHLVSVTEYDADSLNAGRNQWRKALRRIVDCRTADEWPGYTITEAQTVRIPEYLIKE